MKSVRGSARCVKPYACVSEDQVRSDFGDFPPIPNGPHFYVAHPLLVRHIWDIMPFDNEVVVGTFPGGDLPAVVLAGRKVDPDRDYTLAVSDFTAANQGAEDSLGTAGLKFPHEVGLMRDMLIDWFRKTKVIE